MNRLRLVIAFMTALIFVGAAPVEAQKKKLTVLPFTNRDDRGQCSWYSIAFSDLFTHVLVKADQFEVLERQRLDNILEEINLGCCGIVSADRAVAAGKLSKVDFVVYGSFLDRGDKIDVEAHVIDVRRAEPVSVVIVQSRKDEILAKLPELAARLVKDISKPLSSEQLAKLQSLPTNSFGALEHFYRGVQTLDMDDHSKAMMHLLSSVNLDPRYAKPRFWLGQLYLRQGHFEHAAVHYSRLADCRDVTDLDYGKLSSAASQLIRSGLLNRHEELMAIALRGVPPERRIESVLADYRYRHGRLPDDVPYLNYLTGEQGEVVKIEGRTGSIEPGGRTIRFFRSYNNVHHAIFVAPPGKVITAVQSEHGGETITNELPGPVTSYTINASVRPMDVTFTARDNAEFALVHFESAPSEALVHLNGHKTAMRTPCRLFIEPGTASFGYELHQRFPVLYTPWRSSSRGLTYGRTGFQTIDVQAGKEYRQSLNIEVTADPAEFEDDIHKEIGRQGAENHAVVWHSMRRSLGYVKRSKNIDVYADDEIGMYVVWSQRSEAADREQGVEAWISHVAFNPTRARNRVLDVDGARIVHLPVLMRAGNGDGVLVFWDRRLDGRFSIRFATSRNFKQWTAGPFFSGAPTTERLEGTFQLSRGYWTNDRPCVFTGHGMVWRWNGRVFDAPVELASSSDATGGWHAIASTGNTTYVLVRQGGRGVVQRFVDDKVDDHLADVTHPTDLVIRKQLADGTIVHSAYKSEANLFLVGGNRLLFCDGFTGATIDSNASVRQKLNLQPVAKRWDWPDFHPTCVRAGAISQPSDLVDVAMARTKSGRLYRAWLMNYRYSYATNNTTFIVAGYADQ